MEVSFLCCSIKVGLWPQNQAIITIVMDWRYVAREHYYMPLGPGESWHFNMRTNLYAHWVRYSTGERTSARSKQITGLYRTHRRVNGPEPQTSTHMGTDVAPIGILGRALINRLRSVALRVAAMVRSDEQSANNEPARLKKKKHRKIKTTLHIVDTRS